MKTNPELYKIFVAAAQTGSFSAGAKALYLTQSAVSQAVHKLEQQLGVPLFVRGRRGVMLTQEGRLLYDHAVQALQLLEAGEQKLMRLRELNEGLLRIGAADTITKEYLLAYLSAFRQLHPNVQLQVTNRTSRQLTELLAQGRLDLAIVNLPIDDKRFEVHPIFEVHDIFVAGHPFNALEGRPLSAQELVRYPLVMLERASNSRRYVDEYFRTQGIEPAPEIELGAHELLASFAAIGFGIACVVEEFCTRPLEEGVVFPIRLVPPVPARSIGACWMKDMPLSAAAAELMRLLHDAPAKRNADVPAGTEYTNGIK